MKISDKPALTQPETPAPKKTAPPSVRSPAVAVPDSMKDHDAAAEVSKARA